MANQEVKFSNFYESTISTGGLPQSVESCTLTTAPTTDGSTAIGANYYLVVDPDNVSAREVIEVTAATGTSLTAVTRDKEGRYGTPGDASTAPNHAEGTVVRMAVVKEMFEDLHDRIDEGVTASSTTVLTNKTISSASNTLTVDADNATVSNLEVDNLKAATLVTDSEGIGSNDNNTTLPTSAAVKDYVDTQVATKASVGLVLALGG